MGVKINAVKEKKRNDQHSELSPEALRYHIVTRSNTQHLIELYYWSGEEHLVEMMRAFIRLPDETKTALASYLKLSVEKSDLVDASITENGQLVISSSQVCHELLTHGDTIDSHEPKWAKH